MSFINEKLHLFCAKLAWKKQFPGNSRLGFNPVGTENITIGRGTYGHINILTSDANPCLSIGSYCSIARDVTFVIGDEHPLNLFSTFPFKVMTLGEPVKEAFGKGGVTVGDDVWLGYRSTILDGVTIARGGVVAAEALVTEDVEPYTIVGGVPARPIRKRFDNETIAALCDLDFNRIDRRWISAHLEQLYRPMDLQLAGELLADAGSGNEL